MTGARSRALLTGPKAGVDFAAIRVGSSYLLVSSDPVTGVSEGIGRYAVTVSANDIATSGNAPQFVGSVILLPEGSARNDLMRIVDDIHTTAKRSGITIVGGHTEVTPGLRRPIVSVTAFSFVGSFVSSEMAKEGDVILMTKTAGLEGTVVCASEARKFGKRLQAGLVRRARALEERLSVVREAVGAYKTGLVHAMHDCTEGGVIGAAYEMSLASGLGFMLRADAVPVAAATQEVCRSLSLDPLRLIGSGSLLIAVPEGSQQRVMRAVERVAPVAMIGRFISRERFLLERDGSKTIVRAAPTDELWRRLARST